MTRTERILVEAGLLVGVPVLALAALLFGGSSGASPQASGPPAAGPGASSTADLPSYEDLLASQLDIPVDQLRNAEVRAGGAYFDQLRDRIEAWIDMTFGSKNGAGPTDPTPPTTPAP